MARVDWPGFGETRDPAVIDDLLTDLETETAAVDGDNLGHAGLTRDRFAANVAMEPLFNIVSTERQVAPGLAAGAYSPLIITGGGGPVTFLNLFAGPGLVLGATDVVLIRAHVRFRSTIAAGTGIPPALSTGLLEVVGQVGGFPIVIPGSAAPIETIDPAGWHARAATSIAVRGPVTYGYLALRLTLAGAGAWYPGHASFRGTRLRGV